jgi:hypothetical protein
MRFKVIKKFKEVHMQDDDLVRSEKIASSNDEYRKKRQGFMVTRGVSVLPDITTVLLLVQDFNKFSKDNDPYSEHDFGSFVCFGRKLFWKIDYYDSNLEYWADPLSSKCHRVLTVILAEEY